MWLSDEVLCISDELQNMGQGDGIWGIWCWDRRLPAGSQLDFVNGSMTSRVPTQFRYGASNRGCGVSDPAGPVGAEPACFDMRNPASADYAQMRVLIDFDGTSADSI